MTRFRESIKNAERAAWPAVKAALAEQSTPIIIDKLMRSRQVRSNVRFVVEQTIEELAKAGLLRTPVDAEVIGKAVEWYEVNPQLQRAEVRDAEDGLEDAVTRMLEEVGDWPRPS